MTHSVLAVKKTTEGRMKKVLAVALTSLTLIGCVEKSDLALIDQKQAALE